MDAKDIVKSVYQKFLDRRDKRSRARARQIGSSSAVSSVFQLNSDVIGKAATVNNGYNAFLINREFAWQQMQRAINSDPNKDILSKLICIPFHTERVRDYIVTLEPVVKGGKDMNFYCEDLDFVSNHFKTFMFILFDILLYLGKTYGFNHNDLHFGNVMVVKAKDYGITSYTSMNGDPSIVIQDVKYFPVIIDFDWSTFILTSSQVTLPPEIKEQISYQIQEGTCQANACESVLFRCIHAKYKEYRVTSNGTVTFGSFASETPTWSPYVDSAFFIEYARCFLNTTPDGSSLRTALNNALSIFEGKELHINIVWDALKPKQ
jgi:hypothetical protein